MSLLILASKDGRLIMPLIYFLEIYLVPLLTAVRFN